MNEGPNASPPSPGTKKNPVSKPPGKKGPSSTPGSEKGSRLRKGSKKSSLSPTGSKKDSLSPVGSKKESLSPSGSKKDSLSPVGSKKESLSPSGSKKDLVSPARSKKGSVSPAGGKKDPLSPAGSKKDPLSPAGSKKDPLSPAESKKGSVPLASTKKTISQPEKIKTPPFPGSKKRSASEPLGEHGLHASPKDAPALGGMAPGGNDTLDPAPGSDRSGAHRSEAKDNHPQPLSTPAPRRGRRNVIIGVLVVVVIALAALLLLLMSKASKAKGTPQPSTDVISSRTSPSFSSPSTSSYPSFTPSSSPSSPFPPRPTPPGPIPPWTTPSRPTPPWTTPSRPTPPWTTPSRPTPPWTTPFRPTPPKWTTPYKVTPSPPQCDTEACQRVADELNPGQYGGSPCENFYSYVCGERNHKHKQAYEAELFGKLVDDVAEGIRAQTWIPGTGQTATQKAAKAYQACENIVAENRTNMDTVKRILREAGFFSPNEWRDSLGILNASFFLAATWRIASPFRIEYMQHTGLGFTLRIGLSQSAVAYVKERGKPEWNARSRNDFDTMEATFQAPGEPKISYDDWKRVDDSVTTEWRNILDFRSGQTMFQGWNETTVYDSIHEINRTDWDFLLRKYFNSTGARRLYLGSPELLRNFAGIPTRLGAKKARAFYRWYMVEILACVVYAPWVTRRFGSREGALKLQRRFCFAIMEKSAGYAFLAPFIKKKFTAQVKVNIAGILSQVHKAYEKDLFAGSAVFPVSIRQLPAYDYSGGQVFRLLNVSDDSTLDKHYAKYKDMTDDPLVNWKRLRTGLTESSYGDVTMTSAGAVIKSVRFFTIDPYRLDFALRPDLAVLPFFDRSLPPVLELAGLGPILASAIIETLRAGQIGWSQRESFAWNEARDCMRGPGTPPDLLERTVALAAVASALKKTPDSPRALKENVAGLSNPLQVLFTAWCHLKCGDNYGKELCNEPLKELNSFFDAFQCDYRAGMRKYKNCTAGWFHV